ncbi:hypothetical protein [Marinobacter shengliensis]|uniref:hypothetical protein n=1 Tax=Marinobacter shengliensis TaxID=1389223 RepID=UPI001E5DBA06|nr:hypothetical protein [Marinobacter shengliensis]MCD1632054.1 hypothetical protein [Marinobacter shengliensis]
MNGHGGNLHSLRDLPGTYEKSGLGIIPTVIDEPLPQADGTVGGFAKFSGAKFSLPPAGLGLSDLAGGHKNLWETAVKVLDYLGIAHKDTNLSNDLNQEHSHLRSYSSIVLTPIEIDSLVKSLEKSLGQVGIPVVKGNCQNIDKNGNRITTTIKQNGIIKKFTSENIIYAGGRLGVDILKNAGIIATDGKGIDIGVRVEFFNHKGLRALRDLGPDAKIIKNNCRTFCLNVPGEIYRYRFGELMIPGGIVASPENTSSNVGILLRLKDKEAVLKRIKEKSSKIEKKYLEKGVRVANGIFGATSHIMDEIYGEENKASLESFAKFLNERKLIDWSQPHDIHLPLIDWHWETFGRPNTFKTSEESVYCIGDASGHARGLLQAAISGYLAAEELSREYE